MAFELPKTWGGTPLRDIASRFIPQPLAQSGLGRAVGGLLPGATQAYIEQPLKSPYVEPGRNVPTPKPPPKTTTTGGGQQQQQQVGGDFMQFYPGWGATEARANFQAEFGGDINRLAQARGYGGGGGGGVPSAEEEAKRSAEERMRRFGELVAPVQKDIESYLTSRKPITGMFEEQMTAQGIPTKQSLLAGLEKEQTKLGQQLETLPREDIERRKETGMMTAAAERRIRAMEERPIREQLLKTSTAREAERVGLERAFQLVDKYLDVLREEEQRGMEPLQARLSAGQAEFGQEVEALATRLSGFNKDREAQLKQYEMQVQAGLQLTKQQQQQAFELQKQEIEHLNTLDEIAAKQKGQAWEGDKTETIQAAQTRILQGASRQDIISEFGNTLQLPTIEYILDKYNATLAANEKGGLGGF